MALRLFFFLFLLGFLLSSRAQAQVYEPGYLVRANGDTLRGEIENAFWEEPPASIRFRAGASGLGTVYLPRQLRAVSFTNGRYFRYEILPIDHAATTHLSDLPQGNVTRIETDSLLAEVVAEGPAATLWRVVRLGTTHYLLRRAGQPVLDMSERRYLRQVHEGVLVATDGNNYRNQLHLYFGDCPAAQEAAKSARFTAEGLIAVVQTYHTACTVSQQPARTWAPQAATKRQAGFQAGVLAGARYNRIESPSAELAGTCQDCALHPFGGLYAELLLAGRTTALYGELSWSTFKNQAVQSSSYQSAALFSYRAQLATARLGIRFFSSSARPYQWLFTLGVEVNKSLSPQVTQESGTPAKLQDDGIAFAKPTFLPNLGVGWRRQRVTVTLDGQLYSSSASNSDYFLGNTLFGTNVAARLGLGYRLGRAADAHKATR